MQCIVRKSTRYLCACIPTFEISSFVMINVPMSFHERSEACWRSCNSENGASEVHGHIRELHAGRKEHLKRCCLSAAQHRFPKTIRILKPHHHHDDALSGNAWALKVCRALSRKVRRMTLSSRPTSFFSVLRTLSISSKKNVLWITNSKIVHVSYLHRGARKLRKETFENKTWQIHHLEKPPG